MRCLRHVRLLRNSVASETSETKSHSLAMYAMGLASLHEETTFNIAPQKVYRRDTSPDSPIL